MLNKLNKFLSNWRVQAGVVRQRIIPGCIVRILGGRHVRRGPFAGLRYRISSSGSALAPKLLGTYEHELHASISRIAQYNPDHCFVIGAAEGYYATGFAILLANAQIYAYEGNQTATQMFEQLLRLNGIARERIHLNGWFNRSCMEEIFDKRCIVIMDIEGGEFESFEGVDFNRLKSASFLIELHPRNEQQLNHLFSAMEATHVVNVIYQAPRPLRLEGMSFWEKWNYLQCEYRSCPDRNLWVEALPRAAYEGSEPWAGE